MYPVASDPKPNAVDVRIKEMQRELHEAHKEHASAVHALMTENKALQEEIEEHKDQISIMCKKTRLRERKRLPPTSEVKINPEINATKETLYNEITSFLQEVKDLKNQVGQAEGGSTEKCEQSISSGAGSALRPSGCQKHRRKRNLYSNVHESPAGQPVNDPK